MSDEFKPFDEDEEFNEEDFGEGDCGSGGEEFDEFADYLKPPEDTPGHTNDDGTSFEPIDPLENLWDSEMAPWNNKGQWHQSSNGTGAFKKEGEGCFAIGLPNTEGPGRNTGSMLDCVLSAQHKSIARWPAFETFVGQTIDQLKEEGTEKKPKEEDDGQKGNEDKKD